MIDATIVIPIYDRTKYFLHYLEAGRWDERSLLVVCDGSDEAVVQRLREGTAGHDVRIVAYRPNRGVAHAMGVGAHEVQTPWLGYCGDDDYDLDWGAFAADAEERLADDPEPLLVTMPFVVAFNERLDTQPMYDRRGWDGATGLDLLRTFVRTGEMQALLGGALVPTDLVRACLPEPYFALSEDFMMLARMFARRPGQRLHVPGHGARMRLRHNASISTPGRYDVEKATIHLVSLVAAAQLLAEVDHFSPADLADVLEQRGPVLQRAYGLGRQACTAMTAVVTGDDAFEPDTEEARFVLAHLGEHWEALPPEFRRAVPAAAQRLLGRRQPD